MKLSNNKNLLGSLVKWGVPLAYRNSGSLSLEQTIIQASIRSREDGFYESIVPFLIAKNSKKINFKKFLNLILLNNLESIAGYYCEVANILIPSENLNKIVCSLEERGNKNLELLVKSTKMNFPDLFEKNSIALKWNLLSRGDLKHHFDRWDKWLNN